MRLMQAALVTLFLTGSSLASQDPGVFVDKDGKKKKVERTPFGNTVRAADPEPEPARTLADDPLLRVEEKGDTVTFRRQTPFGDQVWKKKRAELTPEEQSLVEARKRAPGGAVKGAAAAKTAPPAKAAK